MASFDPECWKCSRFASFQGQAARGSLVTCFHRQHIPSRRIEKLLRCEDASHDRNSKTTPPRSYQARDRYCTYQDLVLRSCRFSSTPLFRSSHRPRRNIILSHNTHPPSCGALVVLHIHVYTFRKTIPQTYLVPVCEKVNKYQARSIYTINRMLSVHT